MPRSLFSTLAFLAALLAVGCGVPRNASTYADNDGDDEDSYIDEEESGADDEENSSFVDEAMLRQSGAPLTLGEPTEVPGTGVTMRPPEDAQPLPFGAGFLSMEHRVQISVVVAAGPAEMLDQVRGEPSQRRAEGEVEEVEIGGQTGRMGRDRISSPQAELERGWLLAHDGTRGLAVVATYEAGRAARVWPVLREALAGVEWDRDQELDPARALGIQVARIEGLTPSNTTTANVVLLGRGVSFPPDPGEAVVSIAPLPMQLPPGQGPAVCDQIIARLMPVPTAAIAHEGAIDNGPLPGCERLATAQAEGLEVATYAALVFTEHTPILVTGSVDAAQMASWRERFSAAARAISPAS